MVVRATASSEMAAHTDAMTPFADDVDLDEELAELQADPPADTEVHPEDGDQSAAEELSAEEDDQ